MRIRQPHEFSALSELPLEAPEKLELYFKLVSTLKTYHEATALVTIGYDGSYFSSANRNLGLKPSQTRSLRAEWEVMAMDRIGHLKSLVAQPEFWDLAGMPRAVSHPKFIPRFEERSGGVESRFDIYEHDAQPQYDLHSSLTRLPGIVISENHLTITGEDGVDGMWTMTTVNGIHYFDPLGLPTDQLTPLEQRESAFNYALVAMRDLVEVENLNHYPQRET